MKKSKKEKVNIIATLDDGRYDYETLMRAEEIKSDKKRLEAAMKYHSKMKKRIKSLDDLKDIVKEKVYENREDEMEDEE